jgi:hypothetical protein
MGWEASGREDRSPTRSWWIVAERQGDLLGAKPPGSEIRQGGLSTDPVSNCTEEGITRIGHTATDNDPLRVICGRQPVQGRSDISCNAACHLLRGRIPACSGAEQSRGGRAGGPLRPGPGYRRTCRDRLEAAPLSAPAQCSRFIDDDMANLAGHAVDSM